MKAALKKKPLRDSSVGCPSGFFYKRCFYCPQLYLLTRPVVHVGFGRVTSGSCRCRRRCQRGVLDVLASGKGQLLGLEAEGHATTLMVSVHFDQINN